MIYICVSGVDCEVTYVGTTELNNVPYISVKITCMISFSDKETWMLRLKIWILKFLGESKYSTLNNHLLDKEKTYFEAINNQEEYFRGHENICFMVFPNNILTSHMIFNVPLDFIDDQYFSLHIKTTNFCFTFAMVISNAIIFY